MKAPTVRHFLDAEEEELYNLTERDDYTPVSLLTPELAEFYRKAAEYTLNQPRVKISLRVKQADLLRLKARAAREGIPYQTLINSILHQAVAGETG
jgi:predicted DNA binding CopG/RHH family protein